MNNFYYRGDQLFCEDISIKELTKDVGTPFYLYTYTSLVEHLQEFERVFSAFPHLICFAVKANGNLAILRALAVHGAGAEVVSEGELQRALNAGIPAEKIVFSGVGKRADEIAAALDAGILMLVVESLPELELVNKIAGKLGKKARVAFRINLGIDPHTHRYIATGLEETKFGLGIEEALEAYSKAARMKNIQILGVHTHLGSQITHLDPFVAAVKKLKTVLQELAHKGIHPRYLDLGGGLGITYKPTEKAPTTAEFAEVLLPLLSEIHEKMGIEVILEPGRALVGKAGALITQVLYIKTRESTKKTFVIVDAGMNDLIRPSLYGAYHEILPVQKTGENEAVVDVVGPVCETADYFAQDRALPPLHPGDLLAIMDVGAYGFTMASNYNSRLRPAEVMVRGSEWYIIRSREDWTDLVRREMIPPFLTPGESSRGGR